MTKFWKIFLGIIILFILIATGFIIQKYYIKIAKTPQIIQNLPKLKSISSVIVPQDNSIKEKRGAFLNQVSKKTSPQTIIIIIQDRLNVASSQIVTTNKIWQFESGQAQPDNEKIQKLFIAGLVSDQESAFGEEQGISDLIAEIYSHFPTAKLVPIVFKQDLSKEKVIEFTDKLEQICSDCLLISSVDFSHYQPGALAEIHDDLSIRALTGLNEDLIMGAEVDSPQSLLAAIHWAKLNSTDKFVLAENTNSGKIANDPNAETTSYVFGWFEAGAKAPSSTDLSFMVAGDMMFDRLVSYKFPGTELQKSVQNLGERFFQGTDLSIANLEGPISSEPTKANISPDNLTFNFPPETTNVLKWLHLKAVSLANNHTNNNGAKGLENTRKVLAENNIVAVGGPDGIDDDTKVFTDEGKKLSVITINLLAGKYDLTETIKQEKAKGNYVLIFPHWGNEYEKTHSASQASLAHSWIDAGADMMIGSHPHVVQDGEIYKNRPIIYSIGNLIFDQTFSNQTQQGLVIAGKISDSKITLVLLPTIIKNLQVELTRGQEKQDVVNQLKKSLGLDISQDSYGYDIIEINH